MTSRDLAARAREARKISGLSQTELADRLDVDRSAISHAENWKDNANMNGLRKRIIEELTNSTIEGPIYLENRDGTETEET